MWYIIIQQVRYKIKSRLRVYKDIIRSIAVLEFKALEYKNSVMCEGIYFTFCKIEQTQVIYVVEEHSQTNYAALWHTVGVGDSIHSLLTYSSTLMDWVRSLK